MPKFTNISSGPRGLHTKDGLLWVDRKAAGGVTSQVS
jgi:hypothetical protein